MRMTTVAILVMSLTVVAGMVVVGMAGLVKPRNVGMRPSVVIERLVFAAPSMRMWHRSHLAGEVPQYQHDGKTATQHDPFGKGA